MALDTDVQIASVAVGFVIGFGFLTAWEAMKQTRRNHDPLRSIYIWMIWGEIAANAGIGIMAFLLLNGVVQQTVPVLVFLLISWIFEIQLLMQIIINRIAIIAESRESISKIKWGTAGVVTSINIMVICIWLPSQVTPPVSESFVQVNKYWDPMSKILVMLVDAALNWYFIYAVKKCLLRERNLTKYSPLVSFNLKLMFVSIFMDVVLIALMFLRSGVVFLQFHPVTYTVKLNIEMTMANLIARLAQGRCTDQEFSLNSPSNSDANNRLGHGSSGNQQPWAQTHALPYLHWSEAIHGHSEEGLDRPDQRDNSIYKRTEVEVKIERDPNGNDRCHAKPKTETGSKSDKVEDELPLRSNASQLEIDDRRTMDLDMGRRRHSEPGSKGV